MIWNLSIREMLQEPHIVDDRTRAELATEQWLVNPSEHPAQDGEAEHSISIPGRTQGVSKPALPCHCTESRLPAASPFHYAGLWKAFCAVLGNTRLPLCWVSTSSQASPCAPLAPLKTSRAILLARQWERIDNVAWHMVCSFLFLL